MSETVEELTVIIPTFNRPEILVHTIANIGINLKFEGQRKFLIGDDSDDAGSNSITRKYIEQELPGAQIEVLDGPKRGLGANLNMLLYEAKTDLILQMDDDHHLIKPLDINQFAKDLSGGVHGLGWVRLFLGTEEDLNNDDPFYRFSAKMQDRYWYPAPGVDELYIPSNRPHLKHRRFHEFYGLYKEGLKLGETEVEFCHRYADMHLNGYGDPNHMWVAIPVAAPSFDTWEHVGVSHQRTEYDG